MKRSIRIFLIKRIRPKIIGVACDKSMTKHEANLMNPFVWQETYDYTKQRWRKSDSDQTTSEPTPLHTLFVCHDDELSPGPEIKIRLIPIIVISIQNKNGLFFKWCPAVTVNLIRMKREFSCSSLKTWVARANSKMDDGLNWSVSWMCGGEGIVSRICK